MSCPYCLNFAPSGARREQSKTLVKAYWEFEEGNHWLGFSPNVSVLLEAAYQNWLKNPSEVRSQIHANGFLYNVNYTTLLEEGQRQSQRIRRVGVTADTKENDKAYCTVDPALWQEMQTELQRFREEQEWLLRLLREDEPPERSRCHGKLAEEVGQLWQRVACQAAELQELREEQRKNLELLQDLRAALLPGRLVWAPELALCSDVEAPLAQLGQRRAAVPLKELRRAKNLARPGTKVSYACEGRLLPGVVCGPAWPSPDLEGELCVELLGNDGRRRPVALASLQWRDNGDPFCVGDLVRSKEPDGFRADGPAAGTPGVVLQCESQDGDVVVVRFREVEKFRDVSYTKSQALEELQVDELDLIRPGVAVRARYATPKGLGVVFALHGDATVVVDFLLSWGYHCSAADLEVVEDPPQLEVELISTLSECLTWRELFECEACEES